MKNSVLIALLGLSIGYLTSSQSEAPTEIHADSQRSFGRSISSLSTLAVQTDPASLSVEQRLVMASLSSSSFEKNLASLFVSHSNGDALSSEDYFKITRALAAHVDQDPKSAFSSLKKAFKMRELSAKGFERSTILLLGRTLPAAEKTEMARLGLEYLEKDFGKSEWNKAEANLDSSQMSFPLVAFEDAIRLKRAQSRSAAESWAKKIADTCKNPILKRAFSEKTAKILAESA